MALPLIYVCFGIPRSGSTLACRLSRAVAQRSGFDQAPLLVNPKVPEAPASNFAGRFDPGDLGGMLDAVRAAGRQMVVVKTHAPPGPDMARAVRAGLVQVQAHARDPRDVALSMADAGARGAVWGRFQGGKSVETPEDTRRRLTRFVGIFETWAALPGALCLSYEETAFASAATARRIARHMGVPAAPIRDALAAKSGFTQLNKGRSRRHQHEMTPEQAAAWYADFQDFIDARCAPPPGRGLASRLATQIGRVRGALRRS